MLVGLKVFMDAHEPVTLEEGDRYPLGPPSYVSVVLTAARQSPKLLVGVQIPPGTPNLQHSSIGQDIWFSSRQERFDSAMLYQTL